MAVELHQVSVAGVTGLISLPGTVTNPTEVVLDPAGGPSQEYGKDYIVTGAAATWVMDIGIPGSDFHKVFRSQGVTGIDLRIIYDRT
jgi:hypothetical protein